MFNAQEVADKLGGAWLVKPASTAMYDLDASAGAVFFIDSQPKFDRLIAKLSTESEQSFFIVVNDSVLVKSLDVPVLRAVSFDLAKERLAIQRRSSFRGGIVAITGSVGKTTTKNILNDVLKDSCKVFMGAKSFNTKKMIVKQVLDLRDEDVAILEMSRTASLPGSRLAKPNVAVLTAITESHLGEITSTEEIVKLKSRIFKGLDDHGVAVINCQIPHFNMALKIAKKSTKNIITYGDKKGNFKLLTYSQASGLVKVDLNGTKLNYKLSLEGKHNALNSLAVLAIIQALGFNVVDFLDRFNKISPVDGRGAKSSVYIGSCKLNLINDAFNANPLSMSASLSSFANSRVSGRKILCLGDMLELGELSSQLHAQLLDAVLSVKPDKVYLVGEAMSSLWAVLPNEIKGGHFVKLEHLESALCFDSLGGDTVLFKSSNGTGLYKVFESLKDKYSSRNESFESVRVVVKGDALGGNGFLRWVKKHCATVKLNGWIRVYDEDAIELAMSGNKADVNHILALLISDSDKYLVTSCDVKKYNRRLKPGFFLFKKRSF